MLILFAQNAAPPAGAEAAVAGFAMLVLGLYCFIFLTIIATIAAMIFLYIRMANALEACRPRNRQMEPGHVWLSLIPVFGIVWLILSIIRTSDSLVDELESRGMSSDDDCGKTNGILFYVTSIIACAPINLIFLFMYASKLGQAIERIKRDGRRSRRERDEDEDDQDD